MKKIRCKNCGHYLGKVHHEETYTHLSRENLHQSPCNVGYLKGIGNKCGGINPELKEAE